MEENKALLAKALSVAIDKLLLDDDTENALMLSGMLVSLFSEEDEVEEEVA